MPAQFQLRDLVNHTIIGAMILLLILLFLFLLYPLGWRSAVDHWRLISGNVHEVVLLPTLLIVVYVIGAVVPSTRSLHLFDKSKNYLVRLLQLCRVLPRKFRDEPPQDAAINHLFCQKAEARFSVPNQKIEQTERETALFLLASAAVLSESSSLQQGDIERHFVLMHFNSKLCALFFVCFVVSFFSSAWALLARVSSIPWPGAKPQTLFLLAALFYLLARVSGTKARQNHEHWKNLIVRSFVVMDVSGQPSHEAAKA